MSIPNDPQAHIDAATKLVQDTMEKANIQGVDLIGLCIVMYAYVEQYAEVHDLNLPDIIHTARNINKTVTIERAGMPTDDSVN